jgi:hypothetical protein
VQDGNQRIVGQKVLKRKVCGPAVIVAVRKHILRTGLYTARAGEKVERGNPLPQIPSRDQRVTQ